MIKLHPEPAIDIRFARKIYFVFMFFSILWIIMILAAPLLTDKEFFSERISDFLYLFFSKVCHQEDSRSFHLFGNKLAVCSRCFLIYTGFIAGSVAYPFKYRLNRIDSPSVIYLFIAASLLFLDVILDWTGILKNTFLTRSVTGFITGFILPFFLIPGFIKFFSELNSYFKNSLSYKNK